MTNTHKVQARTLEWVAISFSRGSSQPRDRTQVSCTAGGFFTTELPGKPTYRSKSPNKRKMKYLMRHSSFQKEGHSLITSRATETDEGSAHSNLISNPTLEPLLWNSPHPPGLGPTVFEGTSLLCPHLPGKSIKLFFSTSLKTLSLRFKLAPVYRGRVFGITTEPIQTSVGVEGTWAPGSPQRLASWLHKEKDGFLGRTDPQAIKSPSSHLHSCP